MIMLLSVSANAATPTKQQMEQFKSLPKTQQKALAKRLVSDALSNAGKMVAAKVLGKSAGASSGGGLLD